MRTKWLLLALPLAILGLLLQSSLWVPTYASQAEGNPGRLVTFVRASIGDAKHLNPVVASERFAFEVMDRNVFEGLVAEDENMQVVPRLAERYETTEEAYLAVLPERSLPNGRRADAATLLAALRAAWQAGELGEVGPSITGIEPAPAEVRQLTTTVLARNDEGRETPLDVRLSVDVPERVKLTLSRVEPTLFRELQAVLGAGYFEGYPFEARFKLEKPEQRELVRARFPQLLPIGEHNPVITFFLRPGVRWHDGEPFGAHDVKFTYEAIVNPKNTSPRAGSFEAIKSIEIVDPLTARVTYKRLYSSGIIDWMLPLVPKHLLDDAALEREAKRRRLSDAERQKLSVRTTEFNRNPIGTGPFRFVRWLPDQFIQLSRNEQYWGEKARYRDIFYRIIPDYLTMELEFRAGALDVYDTLPHQAARYRADPDYRVLQYNEGAYAYIGYNARRPPFDDKRVRRALGMAIDVDAIIRHVLSGEGRRSTGPYYSHTPYYDPEVKPLPYDPQAALALLAEAGFRKNARGMLERDGKPFAFTLVTNNGNPQRKAIMTIAQEAWRKLGIDCKIQAFEWTVFLEQFVHQLNFDAIVLGWAGGAITFDKYLYFHSTQVSPYQRNYSGYQNPQADELLTRIGETYDAEELRKLTRQLHRVIAEDQPTTFLYEPIRPLAFDRRIARVTRSPDGTELVRELETPPSGNVYHAIAEWQKLSSVPLATAH